MKCTFTSFSAAKRSGAFLLKGLFLSIICILHPGCVINAGSSGFSSLNAPINGYAQPAFANAYGMCLTVCGYDSKMKAQSQNVASVENSIPAQRTENFPLLPIPLADGNDNGSIHDLDDECTLCIQCTAIMRMVIMLLMIVAMIIV